MSQAKHILVPRQYASAEAVRALPRERLVKFHHMTTTERNALVRSRCIEKLGPKLWRLKDIEVTGPSTDCGKGLVSLEVEKALQLALRAEMRGVPLCA